MPRPTSKKELERLSKINFKKLHNFIVNLELEDQEKGFPAGTMNRNIRDVICHLHHWHTMMLNWHEVGMRGEKPDMPAKGYSWKMTPELNRWIWEHYQNTPLSEAKTLLHESFDQLQKLIHELSEQELFEKERYKWTGTTSIGSYLVSCTSSHYDWALKLILNAQKH